MCHVHCDLLPWKTWQAKLPLSLTRKKSRFATPVSEEEFCNAANGVVPLNTKKNNCWAQRMLNAWIEERNKVSHVHDSRLARVRAPLPYYNGPTQCWKLPNCAVHGIGSTGSAFDVVRIHTTKSFNWLDLQVKSLFLSYGMIYSPWWLLSAIQASSDKSKLPTTNYFSVWKVHLYFKIDRKSQE